MQWEVVSWFVPDLPLLEKPATNLGAQVEARPGEIEAIRRVVLGSEFCGGTSKLASKDTRTTGHPPYLGCWARREEGVPV